jgi:hypothetical protein
MDEDLDIETIERSSLAGELAKRVGAESVMVARHDGTWECWIMGKDRSDWFDNGVLVESIMTFKAEGTTLSCRAGREINLHDPNSIDKFERMHRYCVEYNTCRDCPHAY